MLFNQFCQKKETALMVYNENTKEENYKKPLRSLIIFRVIIISLFLGLAIFITIKSYGFPISQNVLYLLYLIIISTFIFSIAYSLMLKFLDNLRFNIYLQLAIGCTSVLALLEPMISPKGRNSSFSSR